MIIAIDGPAGSGKSTVARGVARRMDFTYLDSGAMYRAVTLAALEAGASIDDGETLGEIARLCRLNLIDLDHDAVQVLLNDRDVSDEIRTPRVTGASSTVAAHAQVREALLTKQRALIEAGNYVVEGRDIGTVVCPDASVKVFLTADPDERARRRAAELERKGFATQAGEVRAAIEQRDKLDSTRSAAPLKVADDAVTIDTTALDAREVVDRVVTLAEQARSTTGR